MTSMESDLFHDKLVVEEPAIIGDVTSSADLFIGSTVALSGNGEVIVERMDVVGEVVTEEVESMEVVAEVKVGSTTEPLAEEAEDLQDDAPAVKVMEGHRYKEEIAEVEEEEGDDGSGATYQQISIDTSLKSRGYMSAGELYDDYEQNLKLIESVRSRTRLYSISTGLADKKVRAERQALWEEVSAESHMEVEICKARWTQLRNEFRQKFNTYEATGKEYHKNWLYYAPLYFLASYMRLHIREKGQSSTNSKPLPKRLRGLPHKLKDYVTHDQFPLGLAATSASLPPPPATKSLSRLENNSTNLSDSSSSGSSESEEERCGGEAGGDGDKSSTSSSGSESGAAVESPEDRGGREEDETPTKRKKGPAFKVKLPNLPLKQSGKNNVPSPKSKNSRLTKSKNGRSCSFPRINASAKDGLKLLINMNNSSHKCSNPDNDKTPKVKRKPGRPFGSYTKARVDKSPKLVMNEEGELVRRRPGRPRIHPIINKPPNGIKRGPGRPFKRRTPTASTPPASSLSAGSSVTADSRVSGAREAAGDSGDGEEEPVLSPSDDRVLLVTITDMTAVDRIFCQRISYQEAEHLQLEGFNINSWLEEGASSPPALDDDARNAAASPVADGPEVELTAAVDVGTEQTRADVEVAVEMSAAEVVMSEEEVSVFSAPEAEEVVNGTEVILSDGETRAVSHQLTEEEIVGGFTCQSFD